MADDRKDTQGAQDTWTLLRTLLAQSGPDERALDKLHGLRRSEIASELPRPTCCSNGRTYMRARCLDDGHGLPRWVSPFPMYPIEPCHLRILVDVHYCPFCGARLPELRRKTTPPAHVHDEDGSGRCRTCKARSIECWCSPPETVYEAACEPSHARYPTEGEGL